MLCHVLFHFIILMVDFQTEFPVADLGLTLLSCLSLVPSVLRLLFYTTQLFRLTYFKTLMFYLDGKNLTNLLNQQRDSCVIYLWPFNRNNNLMKPIFKKKYGILLVVQTYWHQLSGVNQELGGVDTSGIKANRLLLSEALSMSSARM